MMILMSRTGFSFGQNLFFKNGNVFLIKQLLRKNFNTMKYLNVAEKNDAAKNIALHLSRGTSRRVGYLFIYIFHLYDENHIHYIDIFITILINIFFMFVERRAVAIQQNI